MFQSFIKKSAMFLSIAFCMSVVCGTAFAQTNEETEAAANSNLISVALPANAQRVLPQSVPAEVNQTLDKIIESGKGTIERGNSEVIVWAGETYKKSDSPQLVRQLKDKWQAAGWAFEAGGEAEGVTVFTLLKDGRERRAIAGFYGGTEDAFILALTELVKAGNVEMQAVSQNKVIANEEELPAKAATQSNASLRDVVGKWEKKSSGMSSYDGSNKYLGSSGNYESYTIYADGRVDYATLISVQNYGCNLSAFSQSKGRVSLSGSDMTINLGAGTIDRKDTCSPSKDYKKATSPTDFTYNWTVGKDDYGVTQLCLVESKGEKFCYRKVQ